MKYFKKLLGFLSGLLVLAVFLSATPANAGKIRFTDSSICYHVSPYFFENTRATYKLKFNGQMVQGPFTLGRTGEYGADDGRDGIVKPGIPGQYVVEVQCDNIIYSKPILGKFLPTSDIVFSNNSPRVTLFGVWKKANPAGLYTEVRRVAPGSTVQLRFTILDPSAAGVQPDVQVRSIYGTLTKVSITKVSDSGWSARYDWVLPNSSGLFDAYVSLDDGKGGHVEASAKILTQIAPQLPARRPAPPAAIPSDGVPENDQFLTFFSTKSDEFESFGSDSLRGACLYYKDLGFARACNGNSMTTAISFDQWKSKWGFDKLFTDKAHAIYTNKVDLNLERNMWGIQNSDGAAFYVCNYPSEDAQLGPDPQLNRAIKGNALVACVAMEFSRTPGFNGGKKFTKFLVFDPSGRLVRPVNLDGRGLKNIPGACVVCHGASRASGYTHYSETPGAGNPVLESNFLPFDLDNYDFSNKAGYSKHDQQEDFRKLNFMIRDHTKPDQEITDLINGWYPTPTSNFQGDYVPPGWTGTSDLYLGVVKPVCRTCHIALDIKFNSEADFRVYANIGYLSSYVCGNSGVAEKFRYSMPNSLVTFNNFWNSERVDVNQPELLRDYLRGVTGKPFLNCKAPVK